MLTMFAVLQPAEILNDQKTQRIKLSTDPYCNS